MAEIQIPDELKEEMQRMGIEASLLVKILIKQLKEEKEMTDWSVKLGRKAKKGRFKRLLSELSSEERKKLV